MSNSQTQPCGCEIYQVCPKCNPAEWERQTARAAERDKEYTKLFEQAAQIRLDEAKDALTKLPVFMDGTDGSLWQCEADIEWPRVLSGVSDSCHRYLRVSDVIELIKNL